MNLTEEGPMNLTMACRPANLLIALDLGVAGDAGLMGALASFVEGLGAAENGLGLGLLAFADQPTLQLPLLNS